MNRWEIVQQQYPTKLELTEPETHHLPYTTKESLQLISEGNESSSPSLEVKQSTQEE